MNQDFNQRLFLLLCLFYFFHVSNICVCISKWHLLEPAIQSQLRNVGSGICIYLYLPVCFHYFAFLKDFFGTLKGFLWNPQPLAQLCTTDGCPPGRPSTRTVLQELQKLQQFAEICRNFRGIWRKKIANTNSKFAWLKLK